MTSNFALRSSHFCNLKNVLSEGTVNIRSAAPYSTKINVKDQERHSLAKKIIPKLFLFTDASTYQTSSLKWMPPRALSSMASVSDSRQIVEEDNYSLSNISSTGDKEFNHVNCLVWILHESARSFSVAIKTLELAGTGPPVAMAWIGVDVHAWHKNIAYQIAVYSLFIAVIEVELLLSHKRCNNPSPVLNILSPKTNFLGDLIESQLNTKYPKLVQRFRMVELPRITGLFMPLFKKWTAEYAGSGVAGTIMAITCCAAVGKLGSGRISCSFFSNSMEDALVELMTTTHDLVSLEKLHHLATEAGFEEDFLSYFGSKILLNKNLEDIEFWIGLVQRKLSTAFHRESVNNGRSILSNKVQEISLATMALFAYLGRETRLFLSRHGIKDLDKQTKEFVSYIESGILFIYPEFSTLSEYQLLMEVIINEIGWLDFYAAYNLKLCQERRRSKHHSIQAEKDITLRAVFTVCYDVILGFAHYRNSAKQVLDAELLEFLLQSQALLSTCLEDYSAAHDGTTDLQRIGEKDGPEAAHCFFIKGSKNPLVTAARQRQTELVKIEKHSLGSPHSLATSSSGNQAETFVDLDDIALSKSIQQDFFRKSTVQLVAASADIWMGTQLLFVDLSDTLRLLLKKLRGHKVTKRERRKMQRTLSDIATLIPVTILMLLPVSAVGHAAMFAAIKKYMPSLIPSPYSDERLDLVKQLKRMKKMKVQRICIEDTISKDV